METNQQIQSENKDPFAAFKSKIKQNLRGLNQDDGSTEKTDASGIPNQQIYLEDVRKVDF